jgi:hypothetical protein
MVLHHPVLLEPIEVIDTVAEILLAAARLATPR